MKWIKKMGSWIWAVVAGIVIAAVAIIKAILSRQEKRTADAVTTTTTQRNEQAASDTNAAAGAVGRAEGVQIAATNAVVAVTETTPEQSGERLDALADVLNDMKRENR